MDDYSYLPNFQCQFIGEPVIYKNNRPKITLPKEIIDQKLLTERQKYIFIAVRIDENQTNSDTNQ